MQRQRVRSARANISYVVACRDHPDAHLVEDSAAGDQICSACGLVVGDRVIDTGAEWRTFEDQSGPSGSRSRVGPAENPLLMSSSGFTIFEDDTSTTADSSSGAKSANVRKTGTDHVKDRVLQDGFKEIAQIATRLHIPPPIEEHAKQILKMVLRDETRVRRRSSDALVAACLYKACVEGGAPRTFKEMCGATTASRAEIGRCHNLLTRTFGSSLNSITPGDFITRFCSKLDLPKPVELAAASIARKTMELELVSGGISPVSIAAAAIYMASQASDTRRSYKLVYTVAGASFRESYKWMRPRAQDLFPVGYQFTTPIAKLPKT